MTCAAHLLLALFAVSAQAGDEPVRDLPELVAVLERARGPSSWAGATAAARELGALRDARAMTARLDLWEEKWDAFQGALLRDLLYQGMRRATEAEEAEVLLAAGFDRRRHPWLRVLCFRALAASAAPVSARDLFRRGFRRDEAEIRTAWQEAAGRLLADGRVRFGRGAPRDAAEARRRLLATGPPFPHLRELRDWDEDERRALVECAVAHRDPGTRALALRTLAAGPAEDADLARAVPAAFDGDSVATRDAALDVIGRLGLADAVPTLIEDLNDAVRRGGRFPHEEAALLRRLTGRPFGPSPRAWERWWQREGRDWLLAGGMPPLRSGSGGGAGGGAAPTVASFFGLTVHARKVVLVVDGSGSMRSTRVGEASAVEAATREARTLLEGLEDGAAFEVVVVEERPVALFGELRPVRRRALAEAERFLATREYRGTSALVEALETAMATPGAEAVLLVSDGGSSAGRHQFDEFVLEEAVRLHDRYGVQVHTVLVSGNRRHRRFMAELAERTGGRATQVAPARPAAGSGAPRESS